MIAMTTKTYYEILSIPFDSSRPLSAQEIKQAYRRALLTHHPDKTSGYHTDVQKNPSTGSSHDLKPTVDEITLAYRTLSSPSQRASYDRELLLLRSSEKTQGSQQSFHTGLEIIDLDDLAYSEVDNHWFRPCRCGLDKGYMVTEQELEAHEKDGEIVVGCCGCSLWIKVVYGVMDEENGVE